MKNYYLTIAFLIVSFSISFAQLTLYTENFELANNSFTLNTNDISSTAVGYNQWIVNNNFTGGNGSLYCIGFPYYFGYTVINTPLQPNNFTNGPTSSYLHTISNEAIGDNIFASSFLAADGICFLAENYFAKMTNDISTSGNTGVELSFWWICAGSINSYGEVYYSTNAGTTWSLLTSPISQYQNQNSWTQTTISNPNFDNQAQLRFGFRFVNNITTTAADPGFSIDEIEISANCINSNSSITVTQCGSYTVPSGDETYTVNGTYSDTIPNAAGCDSIMTINVTINSVDTSLTVLGNTITANASNATYQWVDCMSAFSPLPGETNQSLVVTTNGIYAVIITQNGCTDTSNCVRLDNVGMEENPLNYISTYPNPSNGDVYLIIPDQITGLHYDVLNGLGAKVNSEIPILNRMQKISLKDCSSGIYFVKIYNENYSRAIKVMLE